MTGEKWAFLRPCGCVFGVLWDYEEVISTPMQAWAEFYRGNKKGRKEAERDGRIVRLWDEDTDHLVILEKDPHI